MEEVRSYWQVASIQHFCTLFQKPFKLPHFEPEELEQAFIIDVPEPPNSYSQSHNINNINHNHNNHHESDGEKLSADISEGDQQQRNQNGNKDDDDDDRGQNEGHHDDDDDDNRDQQQSRISSRNSSLDYVPSYEHRSQPVSTQPPPPPPPPPSQQQQNEEQQELHLLVKLAIALLKPHFNSKISAANWENYLRRLIDMNWVDLEHCPSPLSIPFISPDGIELTRFLNFRDLSLSDKLDIFSALCDYRLWCDDASELLKDYPLDEIRLESIGKDSQGYEYWYFFGTRLYRENKEISQDLICRKKRIKELEYKLIELEKTRILNEQEEKRKAELERAKQLANEAREARLAAKRRQEQEAAAATASARKKRAANTPVLPPRTGLRERRSSTAANNSESQQATPARTLRSRTKPQEPQALVETPPQSSRKTSRNTSKNSKQNETNDRSKPSTPEVPKKSPLEECSEELETIQIKHEERVESWCIICESLEDWESFAKKFEKTKSTNEKYLSAHVNENLLPHIQGIYAKRAAEIRRKERELIFSLATRRVSTRIISKRAQEEEEERQAQIREAEIQKRKEEAEIRLRAELEREIRAKKNRFVINGTSSVGSEDGDGTGGRYNLRQSQNDDLDEFEGIIHPDKLGEFYEALELIVDTVRTSKHAWPFVDRVPDTVPGYYDLIKEPMDLKTLRTKVEFRHYRSLIELEKDFQLLINNCERFNGPKNVYTKMVYKLWKSFRKNVQLYLQRDLHMDEYETFVYPPAPPVQLQQPRSSSQPSCGETNQTNIFQNGVSEEHPTGQEHQQPDLYVQTADNALISNGTSTDPQDTNEVHVGVKMEDEPMQIGVENIESSKSQLDNEKVHQSFHLETNTPQAPELPKPHLTLQYQPTPLDVPVAMVDDDSELPPEPVVEEVVIESYAEPCPDEALIVLHPDAGHVNQNGDQ